jgi:hypothetical protein
MYRNHKKISAMGVVMLLLVILNAVVLEKSFVVNSHFYKWIYITIPLLLIAIVAYRKKVS